MVVGLSILGMMACSIDFENRRLPDPIFHAEDIFGQNRAVQAVAKIAEDPFAELSTTVAQPDVDTQNLKSVSFAGMVKSSLPHDVMGGGWSEATTDKEFLLIHEETSSSGPVPNVIIYGYYDPQTTSNPTLTTRRFASVVDPDFEQTGLWEMSAFISNVVSALSVDNPMSMEEFQAVLSVFQPTLGIGFGYHSFPETFTGWKWVGQNQNGIVYSLGKTNGKFVKPSDELQSMIVSLQDMTTDDLLENITALTEVQQEVSTVAGTPAEMILGTMSYQGQVVYISMMCLTQPTCNQQEVLIDVLNNMSPLGSQDIVSSSLFSSPAELGAKYRLPLFQSPLEAFTSAKSVVNDELTKLKNADETSIFSSIPNQFDALEMIDGASGSGEANVMSTDSIDDTVVNPVEGEASTPAQDDSGY